MGGHGRGDWREGDWRDAEGRGSEGGNVGFAQVKSFVWVAAVRVCDDVFCFEEQYNHGSSVFFSVGHASCRRDKKIKITTIRRQMGVHLEPILWSRKEFEMSAAPLT